MDFPWKEILSLVPLAPRVVEWVKKRLRKRSKRARRGTPDAQAGRERIAFWRTAIDRDDFDPRQFAHSDAYATLRPHLPEDLRQKIDRWRDPYVDVVPPRSGRSPIQARLLDELARVEQEWGLVPPPAPRPPSTLS